jgi:hypothetical protein
MKIQNFSGDTTGSESFVHLLPAAIGLILVGCGALGLLSGTPPYSNATYGFTFTPPPGWRVDAAGSQELTQQVRRRHKDARAMWFVGDENVDHLGLSLMVAFLPPEHQTQPSQYLQQRLEQLQNNMTRPNDSVYTAKVLQLADRKAVQIAICTSYEGRQGCDMVHHVTELFTPQADIRIQFNIWKELYPKYQHQIEHSLASVQVASVQPRAPTPKCQERDLQIIDHGWRKRGSFVTLADFQWQISLKNTSPYPCIVIVGYELLDKNDQVLAFDKSSFAELFEAHESKAIERFSGSIKIDFLPQVHSSRAVLLEVQ